MSREFRRKTARANSVEISLSNLCPRLASIYIRDIRACAGNFVTRYIILDNVWTCTRFEALIRAQAPD